MQFGGESPFGQVTQIFPSDYTGVTAGFNTMADPFTPFGLTNPYPTHGVVGSTFGVPAIQFAYVVDPHFRTPYSENVNFGLQYQITGDTMIEADDAELFSKVDRHHRCECSGPEYHASTIGESKRGIYQSRLRPSAGGLP